MSWNGSSGVGELWLDSRYVLKVEMPLQDFLMD